MPQGTATMWQDIFRIWKITLLPLLPSVGETRECHELQRRGTAAAPGHACWHTASAQRYWTSRFKIHPTAVNFVFRIGSRCRTLRKANRPTQDVTFAGRTSWPAPWSGSSISVVQPSIS